VEISRTGRGSRAAWHRWRARAGQTWLFSGPAFVAAVAYVDPGNFATKIQAGSEFGYQLVWVVVAASLAAVVIQTQSAKLGLVTGRSLPEHIRDGAAAPLVVVAWIGAEIVAMATDLFEAVIAALIGVIAVSYLIEAIMGKPNLAAAVHSFLPRGSRTVKRCC
jgi:NRAMP (natural resistance-associated macrophage protein)-like metal ion transporter